MLAQKTLAKEEAPSPIAYWPAATVAGEREIGYPCCNLSQTGRKPAAFYYIDRFLIQSHTVYLAKIEKRSWFQQTPGNMLANGRVL